MAKGEKGGPAISVSQQCGSRGLKLKYCNLILIRPRLSELIVGTRSYSIIREVGHWDDMIGYLFTSETKF